MHDENFARLVEAAQEVPSDKFKLIVTLLQTAREIGKAEVREQWIAWQDKEKAELQRFMEKMKELERNLKDTKAYDEEFERLEAEIKRLTDRPPSS